MLWLALHIPQFAIELHPLRSTTSAAITEKRHSRRVLIAVNERAKSAGLHRGMDATTALAKDPTLTLIERSMSSERQAMKALAAWSEQFSSIITFDAARWLVWIEVGASRAYFGGLPALISHVDEQIEALGYNAHLGVAPTMEAAALFAMHGNTLIVERRADLNLSLQALPIELLYTAPQIIEALKGIGWRAIGEVLALPRDQLSRRFGVEFTLYVQKLLGEHADPRPHYRAPSHYRRRFEFVEPVESIEAMLFPLRRLLGELQGFLRGRDTALQRLTLELLHHKAPATSVEVRTTTPQRDSARLLALLRERLARTALPLAVTELVLHVKHFVPVGDTQLDLFNAAPARQNEWADLLDKLRARLGERAIKRLGLRDDHRPECAWCVVDRDAINHDDAGSSATAEAERPFWLIDPTPLRRLPQLLGTPERIESGWMTGKECRRDYYIANSSEGSRWWLYKDATTQQWFLHGLWS